MHFSAFHYVLYCTVNDVHANFCEQQITVRKVLVLSDTVDTQLEKGCPSLLTMSRSSSCYSWRVLIDVYSAGLKCTPLHLSVEPHHGGRR